MFSYNELYGTSCVFQSSERIAQQLKLLNQFQPNTALQQRPHIFIMRSAPGMKSAIYGCLVNPAVNWISAKNCNGQPYSSHIFEFTCTTTLLLLLLH